MFKIKVKNTLKRIGIAILRSRQQRADMIVLQSLSDRELKDIGIHRSNIPAVVRSRKK